MDRYACSPVSVFTVETNGLHSAQCPPPIRRRTVRGKLMFQLVLLAFAVLALCGAACQIYFLRRVQSNLEATQEMIKTNVQAQKMDIKPGFQDGPAMPSAHVTGLTVTDSFSSIPLQWEATRGLAFLHEVGYNNGSLVCSKSGLYFVYSKLQLALTNCQTVNDPSTFFFHWVYKGSSDRPLMENRGVFCDTQDSTKWKGSSFLGGSFQLEKGDKVYVRVSHKRLVRVDGDTITFFGLFKI